MDSDLIEVFAKAEASGLVGLMLMTTLVQTGVVEKAVFVEMLDEMISKVPDHANFGPLLRQELESTREALAALP